jgi:hypothetical protein
MFTLTTVEFRVMSAITLSLTATDKQQEQLKQMRQNRGQGLNHKTNSDKSQNLRKNASFCGMG